VFPLLLGQTISTIPMLIMYLQLAIILGCLLLFIASGIVGNQILKKSQTKKSETKTSETILEKS
jgi:membrane protein DedA with SNARE-associated domain